MRKEAKFINYLNAYFKKKGIKNVDPNVNLIEQGIIDSLDIVTLIFEIKKKFKININLNNQKSLNNFSTINEFVKLLKKNLK